MSFFQEEIFHAVDVLHQVLSQFVSGDFVVVMMIGAAIGGGYVLGMARNSLSKGFVGALGGVSVVAFLWLIANLVIFLIDRLPGLV